MEKIYFTSASNLHSLIHAQLAAYAHFLAAGSYFSFAFAKSEKSAGRGGELLSMLEELLSMLFHPDIGI